MEKYIFVCIQDGPFETRSILIPCSKLRSETKEILVNATQKYGEMFLGINAIVINLVTHESGIGRVADPKQNDKNALYYELTMLADGITDCLFPLTDEGILHHKEWYSGAKTQICRGFDHIKNFNRIINSRSDIETSILFLNRETG